MIKDLLAVQPSKCYSTFQSSSGANSRFPSIFCFSNGLASTISLVFARSRIQVLPRRAVGSQSCNPHLVPVPWSLASARCNKAGGGGTVCCHCRLPWYRGGSHRVTTATNLVIFRPSKRLTTVSRLAPLVHNMAYMCILCFICSDAASLNACPARDRRTTESPTLQPSLQCGTGTVPRFQSITKIAICIPTSN